MSFSCGDFESESHLKSATHTHTHNQNQRHTHGHDHFSMASHYCIDFCVCSNINIFYASLFFDLFTCSCCSCCCVLFRSLHTSLLLSGSDHGSLVSYLVVSSLVRLFHPSSLFVFCFMVLCLRALLF